MLSLSSIACKNNSTNGDGGTIQDNFSASISEQLTNAIVASDDSKFNHEVKVLFTVNKSDYTAALTSATKSDNTDVLEKLTYDSSTGIVSFEQLKTEATTTAATYNLGFTVTSGTNSQSFAVTVNLQKATKVTTDNIKACFTDFAIKDSESSSKHSFNLGSASGSTYSDTEATFTDSDNGGGNFSISVLTGNSVFTDALGSEKLGKYFDNPAYGTSTGNGEQTLTLPLTLNPKPEYEWSATTYNLKFTLKQTDDKWTD